MRRRTLLGWIASALPSWAQTAAFPADQRDTLLSIGGVVLPAELGADGVTRITDNFIRWVREYRSGAEMEHGYGNTRLRTKPTSPAPAYLKQLAALQPPVTEDSVRAALQSSGIADLPRNPDGRHVIADFMAFYFRSSEANDLCYRAAIGRDQCRQLAGSDQPPAELR